MNEDKIKTEYGEFKDELYALKVDALSDIVSVALGRNGIKVNDEIIEEMSAYIDNVIEKAFLMGTGDLEM